MDFMSDSQFLEEFIESSVLLHVGYRAVFCAMEWMCCKEEVRIILILFLWKAVRSVVMVGFRGPRVCRVISALHCSLQAVLYQYILSKDVSTGQKFG